VAFAFSALETAALVFAGSIAADPYCLFILARLGKTEGS